MADEQEIEVDQGKGATVCRTCREHIQSGAKKCIHCDSFQDWRHYLNLGNTMVALLVALVSVISLSIPVLTKAIHRDNSELNPTILSVGGYPDVMVVAANNGTRPGYITGLTVDIEDVRHSFRPISFYVKNDAVVGGLPVLIPIGASKEIPFSLNGPYGADRLPLKDYNFTNISCMVTITILNFDGSTNVIKSKRPALEFKNYYLELQR